jgi:hypothetical protein
MRYRLLDLTHDPALSLPRPSRLTALAWPLIDGQLDSCLSAKKAFGAPDLKSSRHQHNGYRTAPAIPHPERCAANAPAPIRRSNHLAHRPHQSAMRSSALARLSILAARAAP